MRKAKSSRHGKELRMSCETGNLCPHNFSSRACAPLGLLRNAAPHAMHASQFRGIFSSTAGNPHARSYGRLTGTARGVYQSDASKGTTATTMKEGFLATERNAVERDFDETRSHSETQRGPSWPSNLERSS